MNWHHVAHIIRDCFKQTAFTVCYESDKELSNTLATSEHGIGALSLWSSLDPPSENLDGRYYWPAGLNGIFFEDNCVDLFVSINYNPDIFYDNSLYVAEEIKRVLKIGGFAFVVNPGLWANDLGHYLSLDTYMEKEIRRYSMFAEENVFVYENI